MQFSSFVKSRARGSIDKTPSIVTHWLLPHLGRLQVGQVAPGHVAALLDAARESGASDSHVRSILCCLRSVMRIAVRDGLAFVDPTKDFKVKVRKAQVRALTPAQRDALDAVLQVTRCHALRVVLWTGLRVSEALALRPEDFDPEAKVLTVRGGKSDAAARRVDVPDCVLLSLIVFLNDPERPHPTTLRRALRATCDVASVPRVRVHDLRHTRVTSLLLAGVPVGYVSKQAGHASAATTLDVYDHWVQVAGRDQRRAWTNS